MTARTAPRFFVPPAPGVRAPMVVGQDVALPPPETHHAAHVLRLGPGDTVEVFDGCGGAAAGPLVAVDRRSAVVRVETVYPLAAAPRPALRLAFAVPKGKRLDWLLEKATELGVARLAPVAFARSVAGRHPLGPGARRRWSARCIAAAKQARVAYLPVVEPVRPVAAAIAPAGPGIVGDPAPGAPGLADALGALAAATPDTVHIYVGPEGGLTDDERAAFAGAGVTAVRLGSTILRTETASVALLAATVALLGA